MLIQNDHLFRVNLLKRLNREDFEFFSAELRADIKRLIKKKGIDVALLDLSGFKPERFKIMQLIKKTSPLTEVITLSTSGNTALSIEAMKLGAFDDILVPFDINTLIDRIQAASQKKREAEKKRGKTSLLQNCQKVIEAAAFAEAGEHETAQAYLKTRGRQPADKNKKENSNDR